MERSREMSEKFIPPARVETIHKMIEDRFERNEELAGWAIRKKSGLKYAEKLICDEDGFLEAKYNITLSNRDELTKQLFAGMTVREIENNCIIKKEIYSAVMYPGGRISMASKYTVERENDPKKKNITIIRGEAACTEFEKAILEIPV